jgi:hypothetical protein
MIYFTSVDTTPTQFFLGRLEPPPADLGRWRVTGTEGGLQREERSLLQGGRPAAKHLVHQVRFRNCETGAIERVEPERLLRRRRVSSRARSESS